MSRYFYHAFYDIGPGESFEADLLDPESARREAVLTLAESLRDCPETAWGNRRLGVRVTDITGAVVAIITVSAA